MSNTESTTVARTHFSDSLSCACSSVLKPHARLLDIGTGAGFPGIPLKIHRPDLHVTVVDAVSKKIAFVRHVCRTLALQHVECLASRVELLHPGGPSEIIEPFDVIVSRAVGSFSYLLSISAPLLKADGCLLLQRGPRALQELAEQTDDIGNTGFQVSQAQEIQCSWLDHPRYLVELHRMA